jgi:nitrogen regulatory protein PII
LVGRRGTLRSTNGPLDKVMETVGKAARTGKIGDGKIMVSALERAICIRTGETNESAL